MTESGGNVTVRAAVGVPGFAEEIAQRKPFRAPPVTMRLPRESGHQERTHPRNVSLRAAGTP